MAIVINGSGTVTGISVGGLPDGIVDDGTLATDSVTAAKLKDDAIATGDLPAGSVIQVVSSTVRTSQDTTTSGTPAEINSAYRVTITPTATSSKILLMFFGGWHIGEDSSMGMGIYRSVDGGGYSMVNTGSSDETYRNRDDSFVEQSSGAIMHYDSPSTTDVCIYTPYYWRSSGSEAIAVNDNSMGSFMLGMEVAG